MSGGSGAGVHWSSRFAFLMSAIGSAVGLGNLWRFPFMTGQNGGSAFVFVYILCVALIAYPILMAELAIGRRMGLSAVGSTREIAREAGASPLWQVAGWAGIVAGFFIVSTYCVIAGQVMAYSAMGFLGQLSGDTTPLYEGQVTAIAWHTVFMVLTISIVAAGVQGGIERVCTLLMPLFFLMLAALAVYSLATGDAKAALEYLFTPRFDELTPSVFLAALGQAFFSIGVGAGILMTYGAFVSRETNLGSTSAVIAVADTLVAIVAGLMIFPIVFGFGLDPAAGSGLIFGALPKVFTGLPFGSLLAGAFFFLAFIAAITSSISLLLGVAAVGAEQMRMSRAQAAMLFGVLAWIVGAASILAPAAGAWLDFASGSVLLPFGGLLIALVAGWVAPRAMMRSEFQNVGESLFRFWRFFIRYAAPIAVAFIIVFGVDARFEFGLNAWLSSIGG